MITSPFYFQSPFPMLPMPQTTLLPCPTKPLSPFPSGKYFWDFFSCLLAWLTHKTFLCCKPPYLSVWLAVGFPSGSVVKNLPAMKEKQETYLIPESGRSPGRGNGNPLQDPCWESPIDRGAWRAMVHGIAKSHTQPSTQEHTCRASGASETAG